MAEAEVIPDPALTQISKRTKIIAISLVSEPGADVNYLFINDICG